MPLTDQWQGYTGLPDYGDPGTLPKYLQDLFTFVGNRAVPRYATPAARDAELASPADGQLAWVGTPAALHLRTGGAWRIIWSDADDTGWVTTEYLSLGNSVWSISEQHWRRVGKTVQFAGAFKRTGAAINVPSSGDVVNSVIGTIDAAWRPSGPFPVALLSTNSDPGFLCLFTAWGTNGDLRLDRVASAGANGTGAIAVGSTVNVSGIWTV